MMKANRLTSAVEDRIALIAPSRRLRLALAGQVVGRHFGGHPTEVLDAGCGDGLLSLGLARRHPEWHVTGVDLRENLLALARDRADRHAIGNVDFEQRDVTRAPLDGVYDVVLALECLSEIPDDTAAMRGLVESLRPGGMCVIQVPECAWKPVLSSSEPTWREEVRHGYSEAQFHALLVRAGLERVTIEPTYRGTAALAQELRDRIKDTRLAVRTLAFPVFAVAAGLEQKGVTWGPARALFAVAWKPDRTSNSASD